MRTAVDRVRRGKERDVNARFAAMVSHFLFEAEFCNPASGWEKGQVEKNVRDARHRLWQVVPPFPSLPDLNAWLEERCMALWHEIEHGKLPGTVADVWAQEKATLMPMPRPSMALWNTPSASHPPAWSTSSAIATACRRRMPTGR